MLPNVKNSLFVLFYKLKLFDRQGKLSDYVERLRKKNKSRALLSLYGTSRIEEIRKEAMSGLNHICRIHGSVEQGVADALRKILAEGGLKTARIRGLAAACLGNIMDQAAAPLLTTIIRNGGEDQALREYSAEALGRIAGTGSYGELILAYKKIDEDAADGISSGGSGIAKKNYAVNMLLEKLVSEPLPSGESPAQGLGVPGEDRAIDFLIKHLDNNYGRINILEALAWIGGSKTFDAVVKYIEIDIFNELRTMESFSVDDFQARFKRHAQVLKRFGFDQKDIDGHFSKIIENWEKKVSAASSSSYSRGLCPYCNNASTQLLVKNGKAKFYCSKCKSEFS